MHSCTGQILDPQEVARAISHQDVLYLWLDDPTSSVGHLAQIESWLQHNQVGFYSSSSHVCLCFDAVK